MQLENNYSDQSDEECGQSNSENVIQNEKFIRKLEIQRTVLNKLVGDELHTPVLPDHQDEGSSGSDEAL
jgi:hypothetical protein